MVAVPRGVRKQALTLLLAALFAIGLAACGSSDDSTTGATAPAPTTSGGQASPGSESPQGAGANGPEDRGSGSGDSASSGGGSANDSGAAEGSASFREPGGDNSIQNYGEEADPAQRDAAETALVAFMAARAKQDWATTCRYLGRDAVAPLEELAKRSPNLQGKSCAQLLTAVTGSAPTGAFVNTFEPPVASLRVKGNRAFALYHGPEGIDYFMVMTKEGDEWKAASISPSEFPGSG